jgi:hypothetical protein
MRKPEGKAEAGWYDHPTENGYEQYWNGKFWTTKYRLIGEEGPIAIPADQKYLGRLLFRYPIKSDGAFIAYLITVAIGIFYGFSQEISSGDGLAIIIVGFFGALVTVPWIYILFLVFLVPRRIIDKKRGLQKFELVSNAGDQVQVSAKESKRAFTVVGGLLVLSLLIFSGFRATSKSEGDKFYEEQQRISAITAEWNQEAAKLVTLIQDISNGVVGVGEAQERAAVLNATLSPILTRLRDECSDVPIEPISGEGQERAILLSWKMLSVVCDVTPQQYIETLAVYKAQISETSTQADIDYHVAQLKALGERKIAAAIEAIDAISPYATAGERESLQRLRATLGL